jgi:hypothetical protein
MSTSDAVKQYAEMKLRQICTESQGKPIPNWFNIEDMKGFGVRVTEGELNFLLSATAYPVDEEGPGHFLVNVQATFLSKPALRQGYEFMPAPVGTSLQIQNAMFAEDEQELQDGILQWIHDEAENILCQILA